MNHSKKAVDEKHSFEIAKEFLYILQKDMSVERHCDGLLILGKAERREWKSQEEKISQGENKYNNL